MKPAPGMNMAISFGIAFFTTMSTTKSVMPPITMSFRLAELLLDLVPRRGRAVAHQRDDDVEAGLHRLDDGLARRLHQLLADVGPRQPEHREHELRDLDQRERLRDVDARQRAGQPVDQPGLQVVEEVVGEVEEAELGGLDQVADERQRVLEDALERRAGLLDGRRSRSLLFPTKLRWLNATRARRASSAETSMPWTAAACVMIVRMNDKSIANVAGPAPCLARFLPNSINRSRVSAWIFTLPNESFSASITAAFDRRIGFPTSCMSSSCRSIRSENVRTFRTALGLDDPCGRSCAPFRAPTLPRHPPSKSYWPHTAACAAPGRASFQSQFVKVAIACALTSSFVCAMCAPRDQMRYKRVQFWLVWSAHTGCTFLF